MEQELNAVKSTLARPAVDQLFGNPVTGETGGLRVVWDFARQEMWTAFPFPVKIPLQ
jgi:hypothetical protein